MNLGCIDLNPWYARCDDVDRPDYLHFDLDPVPGAISQVWETAMIVQESAGRACGAKFRENHRVARHSCLRPDRPRAAAKGGLDVRQTVRAKPRTMHPNIITAEYRIAKRPQRPRAGGLQSERVGPDIVLGIFGAPETARASFDARDVGRSRARV